MIAKLEDNSELATKTRNFQTKAVSLMRTRKLLKPLKLQTENAQTSFKHLAEKGIATVKEKSTNTTRLKKKTNKTTKSPFNTKLNSEENPNE